MGKSCIYNFTLDELKSKLSEENFSAYRALQVFNWIYKRGVRDFSLMTNISREQRHALSRLFRFIKFEVVQKKRSTDGTEKFLFKLKNRALVETVIIPESGRNTLCLSTQVGCKFNCKFCASARSGFVRNLETSEIINQYLEASKSVKITNIVFMGIGEPLDNFKNVVKAVEIFKSKEGPGVTARRITISTCGLPQEIEKLADLRLGVKLSVSLHSAWDHKRGEIMPVNKKYPLEVLFKSLKKFSIAGGYPVTFEYVMAGGFNTSRQDACKLAKLSNSLNSKINLIPLNFACGGLEEPDESEIKNFRDELKKHRCLAILRRPRGKDIEAACGQLKASLSKSKKPF